MLDIFLNELLFILIILHKQEKDDHTEEINLYLIAGIIEKMWLFKINRLQKPAQYLTPEDYYEGELYNCSI